MSSISKKIRLSALISIAALATVAARGAQIVSVTLDPTSIDGSYFGTLSVQNVDSTLGGPGFFAEFPVAGSSTSFVDVNLSLLSEHEFERYVYGSIGIDGFNVILGGGGSVFRPGVANPYPVESMGQASLRNGIYSSTLTNITTIDVYAELYLAMPWNGVSGDWTGTWSLDWKYTDHPITSAPPAVVPDSLNLFGAVGLTFCAFMVARRKLPLGQA